MSNPTKFFDDIFNKYVFKKEPMGMDIYIVVENYSAYMNVMSGEAASEAIHGVFSTIEKAMEDAKAAIEESLGKELTLDDIEIQGDGNETFISYEDDQSQLIFAVIKKQLNNDS